MIVTILGAGHGGQAMAADLTLAGHEVRLAALPEHPGGLPILSVYGGIYVDGVTSGTHHTGFAKVSMMTTDLAAAVKGAQVIMVVIPAFGQEDYMRALIKVAEPGQMVVFNPGKFGTLTFARMLREAGREGELLIGETASLIYAAKTRQLDHVYIKAIKSELFFAALPATNTERMLAVLNQLFPQFIPADNVLATSVDDTSLILHTVSTIMNTSRIEQMGPYRNAHYDVTPAVGRVMESLDRERIAVSRAFGNFAIPFLLTLRFRYDAVGETLCDALAAVPAYRVQMAPENMKHRYITEEVPFGMVPVSELGRLLGIPTPGFDAVIHLASLANGTDYRATGRHLESLGLAGMSPDELLSFVAPGERRFAY